MNDISSKIAFPGILQGKHILLVVTGGIAAYKCATLIREIRREGGEVRVVMTSSAKEFITPLTLSTLSGNSVAEKMFPSEVPAEPIHLKNLQWADILLVAPASANFIGKVANGIADELSYAIPLAYQGIHLYAPAMNHKMWSNAVVQENVKRLCDRGVNFIGPESGEMAGVNEDAGKGRMSEPHIIIDRIEELFSVRDTWKERKIIVTSGATRESLDPIRFFSNRSSGKMGDAIARQSAIRGAETILIRTKSTTSPPPNGVTLIEVESAAEMAEAVHRTFPSADVLIMAAAVADWAPSTVAPSKMKKNAGLPALDWRETEDILSWAGRFRTKQAVIGFALETDRHLEGAQIKMKEKGIDLIALNDPTKEHSEFGGDTTQLTLLSRDRELIKLSILPKRLAAAKLLDEVERFFPYR